MIWRVIKKALRDAWDELFHLLIFNIIWVIGTVLIIPWPFVTFGLFYIVKDIGEGKGVSMAKFFGYGRGALKSAYIWGGINVAVIILIWTNIQFYGGFNTQWAAALQIFFIAFLLFWVILQLFVLALYPRQVEPSFRLALRNGVILAAHYPLLTFMMVVMAAVTIAISIFVPIIGFLLAFSFIAVVANTFIDAALQQEFDEQQNEEANNSNADK